MKWTEKYNISPWKGSGDKVLKWLQSIFSHPMTTCMWKGSHIVMNPQRIIMWLRSFSLFKQSLIAIFLVQCFGLVAHTFSVLDHSHRSHSVILWPQQAFVFNENAEKTNQQNNKRKKHSALHAL